MITADICLRIYIQMVLPVMEYGIIFLTTASQANQTKLQRYQNRFLRLIFRPERRTTTRSLHLRATLTFIQQIFQTVNEFSI